VSGGGAAGTGIPAAPGIFPRSVNLREVLILCGT